jgi:hypothetical protein
VSRFRRSDLRIRRSRGGFQLRLPEEEREALRSLCSQVRDVLGADDPSSARLFPPGYQDDPVASEEYSTMVHDDLMASHLQAISVMETTIDESHLDEEQVTAWLGALNDLRLVLGTRLDVTEDLYDRELAPGDPRAGAYALFAYLGALQEQVVEALAAGVDPAGTERA